MNLNNEGKYIVSEIDTLGSDLILLNSNNWSKGGLESNKKITNTIDDQGPKTYL